MLSSIEDTLRMLARGAIVPVVLLLGSSLPGFAAEELPWKFPNRDVQVSEYDDNSRYGGNAPRVEQVQPSGDTYSGEGYGAGSTYNSGPPVRNAPHNTSPPGAGTNGGRYGAPYQRRGGENYEHYEQVPPDYDPDARSGGYRGPANGGRGRAGVEHPGTYSQGDIKSAGHKFFGSISQGMASIIEYAFQQSGRPNGYILGEDAGGAFFAGLRYGEGRLYTRDAGSHKVYWQGPSIGYDFGGEGSKTMILVYNLSDPSDIFHRFGGVQGSAYLIGGVSIQFQKYGDVILAPIRSGIGLRLGANVGYLKYTRRPTWNPF